MPSQYPISDMHVFALSRAAGRLSLLREADHLLRRFGQLDLVDIPAGQQTDFELRAEADRFFFPADGNVKAILVDLRSSSPSLGVRAEVVLDASDPHGLLVPFGVACSLAAQSNTRLIVLSTHSTAHPEDRLATRDELDKYSTVQ